MKAAGTLFAKNGFQATTLKQLSKKTKSNGALVAYYFGNKEGLKDAVIDEKLLSLRSLLEKKELVDKEDLKDAIRSLFRHIRQDTNFHRIAQRALLEDPVFKKKLRTRLWEPLFTSFTHLLQLSAPHLPSSEVQVRALVLFGILQQYANLRSFFTDSPLGGGDAEEQLKRYETYVLESIVDDLCRP